MSGSLYRLSFPNGKAYIGVTFRSVEQRFRWHAPSGVRQNVVLHKAIKKYGKKSVKIETLVVASDREYLYELEKKAIVSFSTKVPFGYNMTDGGEGGILGFKHSEASRAKMRVSSAERWTPEARLAMSLAKTGTPSHRKGKTQSLAARAKMSSTKAFNKAVKYCIPFSKLPRGTV